MTDPEAEYGERLRRALHAAADNVVPSGDGLDRIRRRITHQPGHDSLVWLIGWMNSTGAMRLRLSDSRLWLDDTWLRLSEGVLRPAWRWLDDTWQRLSEGVLRPAWRWLGDTWQRLLQPGRSDGWRALVRRWLSDGWLRPVLATAGAVLIATIAVLAIPGLRQGIIEAGSVGTSSNPSAPGSPRGIIPGPVTQPPVQSTRASSTRSPGLSAKPSSSHHPGTVPPTVCPTAPGTATPNPTSTSTSPASTAGPCPTPSPSPSPTSSPTSSPSASPSSSTTP